MSIPKMLILAVLLATWSTVFSGHIVASSTLEYTNEDLVTAFCL